MDDLYFRIRDALIEIKDYQEGKIPLKKITFGEDGARKISYEYVDGREVEKSDLDKKGP